MPPEPESGRPFPQRLYFNDEVPALDQNQLYAAAVARPMGIDMACPSVVRLYHEMRAKEDDKVVREVHGKPWPKPSGQMGFLDELFKVCHPEYEPFPTDAKYFVSTSLGMDRIKKHPRGFTHWTRNCNKCTLLSAQVGEKKQPAAAAAAAAASDAGDSDSEEKKKPKAKTEAKKTKKKKSTKTGLVPHTCSEGAFNVICWPADKAQNETIFCSGGSRNNLNQLLKNAAASGLYSFHLRSLVHGIAVHAWLTINGRWLHYKSPGPDLYNPLAPPFAALCFYLRDLPDPSSEAALAKLAPLIKNGCNMLEVATQLPLTLFLVLVSAFVEQYANSTKCLVLPDDEPARGAFRDGVLFPAQTKDIANSIRDQFMTHFDGSAFRLGWIALGTRDLFDQWPALEAAVTENKDAYRSHEPVAMACRSSSYRVVPPGSNGVARRYDRVGGCSRAAPKGVAASSFASWFYTACLPNYMTSLHVTPERPPLCTDRFYFAIDEQKVPAPIDQILFNEAMFSSNGKYGRTEAAKESSNKNSLSLALGSAKARPDEIGVIRARFSYINAKSKEARVDWIAKKFGRDGGKSESTPRVIPTPSLLIDTLRLPWHDPNEGAIEHLPREYYEHCVRHFSAQDVIDNHVASMDAKDNGSGSSSAAMAVSSFEWQDFHIAVGDRSPFEMYLINDREDDKKSASFTRLLCDRQEMVCGGQVLSAPANVVLRLYMLFLCTVCVLRRVDMAIAVLARLDAQASFQRLVDGARVFRARVLGLAAELNAVYKLDQPDSKVPHKTKCKLIRDKFIAPRVDFEVHPLPGERDARMVATTKERVLDLLAEALLRYSVPIEDISIEGREVSLKTLAERKITGKFRDGRGGVEYLPAIVQRLTEEFDLEVRVPAAVLSAHLNKPGDGTVFKTQPRLDEPTPYRSGPWLSALHAFRMTTKTLAPRAVLRDLNDALKASPQPFHLSALLAAECLLSDDGVPSTLDSFWARARREGMENEIKSVAGRILQGARDEVKIAASTATAAASATTATAVASPEDILKEASGTLQFWFVADKERIPGAVKEQARRLFIARKLAVPVKQCLRDVQLLVPTSVRQVQGGAAAAAAANTESKKDKPAASKKRPRASDADTTGQPAQKKMKRTLDTPGTDEEEGGAEDAQDSPMGSGSGSSSSGATAIDDFDEDSLMEAFSSGAGAGAGGKDAKEE